MSDPAVYLAGPVAHVPDGGARWRDDLESMYGHAYDFKNPLSKYNVPLDDLEIVEGESNPELSKTVGVSELVEGDLELLAESDGVLVGYTPVQSVGTPMEVMWARERNYPVALWTREGSEFKELSPWYRYHTTALTTNPEMGLRHIERQADDVETRDFVEVAIDE